MIAKVTGNRTAGYWVLCGEGYERRGRDGFKRHMANLLTNHRIIGRCFPEDVEGDGWGFHEFEDGDEEVVLEWEDLAFQRTQARVEEKKEEDQKAQEAAREVRYQKWLREREVETASNFRKDEVKAEQNAKDDRCACGTHKLGWCPYPVVREYGHKEQWVPRSSVDLGLYAPASPRRTPY